VQNILRGRTRHSGFNFDVFTIRPDGTDLKQLTMSPANDGHAVWTDDGQQIMYNSGMYGWKEEAALYDRQLTDSLWEDSMPRFVPERATRR
jgi:Tol biopolymer transport system component